MPIYEYLCLDCKKEHEIIQKISDKPLKVCPSCGGKIKKNLSLSSFHLKGGGWYKDGYSSAKGSQESNNKPAPETNPIVAEPKKEKTDKPKAKPSSTS